MNLIHLRISHLKGWKTTLIILVGLIAFMPDAALAKTYKLNFASFTPPRAFIYTKGYVPWLKEIEKRTNERVKIKLFPSQSLVKARDSYDAVVNGIADISYGVHDWNPGRFPLSSVFGLPFMSPESQAGHRVANELVKKYPEMAAEFKDVHLLFLWVSNPGELHTSNRPVRAMEDMKGLKIATTATYSRALNLLGGVPIALPHSEYYMAMEKGVIDAVGLPWGAFYAMKIVEVTEYHTHIHMGGAAMWTAMNKNTWNRLPKDIQDIITQVTKEMMPHTLTKATTLEVYAGLKTIKSKGREVIELSPDEMNRWRETVKPLWNEWAQSMEAKGLPGRAVLKDTDTLIQKYLKE